MPRLSLTPGLRYDSHDHFDMNCRDSSRSSSGTWKTASSGSRREGGQQRHTLTPLAILLLSFACAAEAQEQARLIESEEPITFDGRLNEPVWKRAPAVTGFRQREPVEGQDASETTQIRLVFHGKTLYLGVTCFDANPELIVAKEMKRDGDVDSDDSVAVVLDTYLDHRNAFYFSFNPNGVLKDALVVDEGSGFNVDWNGAWDVKASVTAEGWQAEVMIPFDTLRFRNDGRQAWGANFRRLIRRKNEEVLWQAWGRNAGLMRISEAGAVTGIPRIERAHRFELRPYGVGAWVLAPSPSAPSRLEGDLESKAGLDAKLKLTENLTADVTLNTDFAQTEVDRAVVNLSRFPVQFPEKRDFFLENAGFFDFASPGETRVFFSRRIGLSSKGEPLPMDYGGRITGKIGRFDVGLLDAQSGASDQAPAMNSSVIRAKLGVLKKSYLGAIVTNAHRSGDGRDSQAYGVDASFSFSSVFHQNMSITSSLAQTSAPGLRSDRSAGYFGITWPNDNLDAFFNYSYVQKNFDPQVGFLQRSSFEHYSAKWRFQPRPPAPWDKWIRKIYVKPMELSVYRTLPGQQLESLKQELRPLGMDLQSGESFEFNIIRRFDRLDEPFDVFGDVVIPKGRYWWTSYEVQGNTANKRPWQVSASVAWGGYYSGAMRELSIDGSLSLSKQLRVALEHATNHADFGGASFTTHEIAARLVYAFSNRANVQVFTQWNNESRVADVYVRLQISPKVGSDIFGVVNQLIDTRRGRWADLGRTVHGKVVYPVSF